MNAHMKNTAYGNVHQMTLKSRGAEAEALIKSARLLEAARQNPQDSDAWQKALDFNTKLWTAFQADLSEPSHPMPPNLRRKMLSLSIHVDRQTTRALKVRDADNLNCLIDINRNIGQGLMATSHAKGTT